MIGKPALFLDRDGVINVNHGYVSKKDDFKFYAEIFEICIIAQNNQIPIIIVTNQSGIGRGFFSEEDYQSLTDWMISEFKTQGIEITSVLYAPENPEDDEGSDVQRRKPSPAMILEAAQEFGISLDRSIMIGDSESDMIAAKNGGIRHRILIGANVRSTVASVVVDTHLRCIEVVSEIVTEYRES
jgi:D-glycero-D-manno-heptose 1,7-bisphosphate phosphatase